jgi:tRNA (guanine37-N1)-methyltransferase
VRIDVISAVPAILESPLNESILKRAQENGLVELHIHNLRDYAHDRHLTIDDVPYGGSAGMVLKPEPIFECVESLKSQREYDAVIYLSADGERFDQKMAARLSLCSNLLFLCGHYKGIDERVRESLITREISIGDFVLTGGELPALVVIDAVVRLIPGVLHDGESALSDSFQDHLLDCPWYTSPPVYREMKVPEVLLSGNHAEIEKWREEKRLQRTQTKRKDLLE